MTTEIRLQRGFVALIDDADAESVLAAGHWSAKPHRRTVYVRRNINLPDGSRRKQYLHTFLTGWALVDHRNGNGLDNRRENMRSASNAENGANRCAVSSSGFKGVDWRSVKRRWRARITIDGQQIHLGTFLVPEEAARAYDEAAARLFGEFARLNFPREEAS